MHVRKKKKRKKEEGHVEEKRSAVLKEEDCLKMQRDVGRGINRKRRDSEGSGGNGGKVTRAAAASGDTCTESAKSA